MEVLRWDDEMGLVAVVTVTVAGLLAGGAATADARRAGKARRTSSAAGVGRGRGHHDPRSRARTRSRPGWCSPAGSLKKHSQAGVLWLHWLGEINGDRSEYLSEAVTLAGKGVVSVLPQGYFPWVPEPRRHDR